VHLNDALGYGKPQAGAALLAGDGIVGLLELVKQLGLIDSRDAGASVTDRYMECAVVRFGLDGDFAGIGEFDGIADEINQDLRLPKHAALELVAFGGCVAHFVS
jgi:hypothetical protein